MKIITENEIRWLTIENENNFLLDITQKNVLGKRIILAKSISVENMYDFFKEITPEEAEEINQLTEKNAI